MSRKLSQKHINAYLNGIFQKLFKGIKEDPELSLEIRKDDEAMVYYRKGKILTTGMRKEQPYIKMLDKQYYKDKKAPSVDIENLGNIGNITSIRRYFKEAKKLVYEYQKGVCTDYAFLFQTLCEGAGIECSSISNTTHRWNEVVIDGQPLEIDVCWNDDDYTNEYRSQYYLIPRASMAQYPSHGNWDLKL